MTAAILKPATPADVDTVGRGMRASDVHECWVATSLEGLEALRQSAAASVAPVVMEIDGEPACIAGITPTKFDGLGVPWMLGTELIERRQHAFLRGCLPWIKQASLEWRALLNFVSAENKLSHRWLAWLGFTLGSPQPYGVIGASFLPFWMGDSSLIHRIRR